MRVLGKARQHLQGFLLRHGRIYAGKKGWTLAYRRWLTTVRFDHPASQIVLQDYIHAVSDAEVRVDRLTKQIEELAPQWSMAPVVEAVQAMRGVAFIVAVTVVAEVGDFSRFDNPRQLMAYLGLVPSEHSSGATTRRGGITKAGNTLARRALIEGAWTYRMQARVSRKLHDRNERLPQVIRDIAWKAQVRLCARYRRLSMAGKPKVIVTTAIAREMLGFLWAIARQVQLGPAA
jgi:transposase